MAWVLLVVAGLMEVGWAVGMRYTDGFRRFWPIVICVFCMFASGAGLFTAARTLPVGTAYAVWTGVGAAGTAIASMYLFNESRDILRVLCIFLIIAGVIGLRLLSPPEQ